MSLHLHESILLLSLDDEKGSFSMSGTYLYYGFAAALLLDLILGERIVVEEGRVSVIDKAITENRLLNDVLGRLKRFKKDRKVAYCIHYLVQRINKLRPQAIEHLIRQGILERREEKILWVFTVSRYPSANAEPEHTLRERLHSVAFHNAEPTPKERMLLSIILACKLERDLFPDKEERKAARERLKALTEDSELRRLIGQAVLEMQAAVMAATTASF
ncbi:MAG: GPP34 family phosphoprotein [Phaeodactylibacter sp.]|nr:GPP34 family phosphoprotein [Phaeodactylibacter sp.]MCB9286936.1 GPP34 family phosphoprotein [Lewinellaceae bacterium]